MLKIKLGKSKSKLSSNENNRIGVELKSQSQLLFSDMIAGDINQYAEYIAEKDASQKYRIYYSQTILQQYPFQHLYGNRLQGGFARYGLYWR